MRPVLFILGVLIAALAGLMLAPAAVDFASGSPDWRIFLRAALLTGFVGGLLIAGNQGGPIRLTLRQGFVLTACGWILLAVFAALPLYLAGAGLSVTDAVFESVSGLTTTGSTVLVGLDAMPPGLLLWRALLQWVGGIGIIVMALAILPYLRVGGMQLFKMESSATSEKALPRAAQIAAATVAAYIVLSVLCALAYYVEGMTALEAAAHAMTTIATGGYSTSDGSLGHFGSPAIEWTATLFMLLGGLPFVLYFRAVAGRRPAVIWGDSQVRLFVSLLAAVTAVIAAWLVAVRGGGPVEAVRLAAFNVTSVATTTGYASADYALWGAFPVVVFFFLTFVGGCTGSTAGGIKMFRFQLLYYLLRAQLVRLISPHTVRPMRYHGVSLESDVLASGAAFQFVFFTAFWVTVMGLAALGLDWTTALSGAATALANVGPGLGETIGPAGNFAPLPDAAKWLLCGAMLLGRLEFFTLLILLTPGFWRDV